MKSLLQKYLAVSLTGTLFLSFGISQIFVMPLLADEIMDISDIKDCRAIENETERLACYDTVSDGGIFNQQKLKEVQVEEFGSRTMPKAADPAPEPAAAPSSSVSPATATPSVATTTKKPKQDDNADQLSVTIIRSKKDGKGFHYFQTSDGQVWKQINATSWSLSVPFDAVIRAGVFGSFFLENEGGKSTRVKRVR